MIWFISYCQNLDAQNNDFVSFEKCELNACVRVKFGGSLCFWQISFFFCQHLKDVSEKNTMTRNNKNIFSIGTKPLLKDFFETSLGKSIKIVVIMTSSHPKMTSWLAVMRSSLEKDLFLFDNLAVPLALNGINRINGENYTIDVYHCMY